MITIVFNNSGGELDRQTAHSAADAAKVAADMILSAGEIYPGDCIVVSGKEEETD